MIATAGGTAYDNANARGLNCFDGNRVSLLCDDRSVFHFGHKDPFLNEVYQNDLNSFRNPRWRNPQTQEYINVHVRNAFWVNAEHNFWVPSGTATWLIEMTMFVSAEFPVLNSAEVRCGAGFSQGGPIVENQGSQTTKNLVRLVQSDSLRAAWELCKTNLSDNLDEHEAPIFTWALQMLRLSGNVDSAQILLEEEAFASVEGEMSALDAHSLLALRGIYILLGDSTGAWRTYDTLAARLPITCLRDDSLSVELYRIDILWHLEKDYPAAADAITTLYATHAVYPSVRNRYAQITKDTSVYWYGVTEELEKATVAGYAGEEASGISVLECHPNPFNPSTTIRYVLSEQSQVLFSVYSLDGRLLDRSDLGVRDEGEHYHHYTVRDLATGVYYGVLETSRHRSSFKLILGK
jgi:hypothetical protein